MKTLRECKETFDKIVKWCNDNAIEDAEDIERYVDAIRELAVRSVEHLLDFDWDYIRDNYNNWNEYLLETVNVDLEEFNTLTERALPNLWEK